MQPIDGNEDHPQREHPTAAVTKKNKSLINRIFSSKKRPQQTNVGGLIKAFSCVDLDKNFRYKPVSAPSNEIKLEKSKEKAKKNISKLLFDSAKDEKPPFKTSNPSKFKSSRFIKLDINRHKSCINLFKNEEFKPLSSSSTSKN